MLSTITDAYQHYSDLCAGDPPHTLDELRDRIHTDGLRYEDLDQDWWDELFDSGWAWDCEPS